MHAATEGSESGWFDKFTTLDDLLKAIGPVVKDLLAHEGLTIEAWVRSAIMEYLDGQTPV